MAARPGKPQVGEYRPLTELPFGAWTAEAIGGYNRLLCKSAVYAFQDAVLRGERLVLPCPITGRPVESDGCAVLGGINTTGYHFPSERPFWAIAIDVRHGYPLSEIYLPGLDQGFFIEGPYARKLRRCQYAPEFEKLWQAPGRVPAIDEPRPRLLAGHANFAHYMWNQLPAIALWADRADADAIRNIVIAPNFEPLGPLEILIPRLKNAALDRSRMQEASGLRHSRVFTRALATNLGSMRMSREIRQRLRTIAAEQADRGFFDPRLSGARPIVWITARTDRRTCVNQTEFLGQLLSAIGANYPEAVCVIDSFSFPQDYQGVHLDAVREGMISREQVDHRYIDDLIASFPDSAAPAVNICGFTLLDAMAIGGRADFYVTHAGTIQHKIGWVHDVPGYIHGPVAALTPGYYASSIEGGVRPDMVPEAYVTDEPSEDARSPAHRCYRLDAPAVVADIIETMSRRIAPRKHG